MVMRDVMFKLRNRQGPLSFLFQQSLHNHSHHHLFMAHLLGYDPCSHFSRAFSLYPSISSYSEVNRSIGFVVKGCFDSNGAGASGNGNRVFVKEKTKPCGFAPLLPPPLLDDLEKGVSVRKDDGCDATLDNGDNRSRSGIPTKPFCFPDHHFSHKLVAVDVDEGRATIGLVKEDKTNRFNLEEGDIIRVKSGHPCLCG